MSMELSRALELARCLDAVGSNSTMESALITLAGEVRARAEQVASLEAGLESSRAAHERTSDRLGQAEFERDAAYSRIDVLQSIADQVECERIARVTEDAEIISFTARVRARIFGKAVTR